MDSQNMNEEFEEYTVFVIEDKDGNEVEMAVVDEFSYEDVAYVAAAKVEGDSISEDGVFIFKVEEDSEDFLVSKIEDPEQYQKVAEAYLAM